MEKQELFQVDQLVETRSFQPGYRGAWFNCKIIQKKGEMVCLEYCDFPDERLHWTKIYQKPQGRKPIDGKRVLMLRPSFPPIYHESQLPTASPISGVAVVVNNVWHVGDLVDWRADDCYWSGKITDVLGNGKYKIELLPPPFGEGSSYEGSINQFRPSLEWSPEESWTLPIPPPAPGWKNCRSPAQLINPMKQEGSKKTAHAVDNSMKEFEEKTDAVSLAFNTLAGSLPPSYGFSRMGNKLPSSVASKETKTAEKPGNADVKDGGVGKTSFMASISSFQAGDASIKVVCNSAENGDQHNHGPSKKTGTNRSITLNSMEATASLPPPVKLEQRRRPFSAPSRETKTTETDVNVRGKQPTSTSSEMAVNIGENSGQLDAGPSKKMRTDGNFCLNFTDSNSTEAAILDLEELVNKVKWIKGILQFGLPNSRPSWKFIEHRSSSMPK